jgi:hypothetical protein
MHIRSVIQTSFGPRALLRYLMGQVCLTPAKLRVLICAITRPSERDGHQWSAARAAADRRGAA